MGKIRRDDKFELKVVCVIGGLFRSFNFRLVENIIFHLVEMEKYTDVRVRHQ